MATFTFKTKLTVRVFGSTGPDGHAGLTIYGACFRHAVRKLVNEIGDTLYRIEKVESGEYGDFEAFGDDAREIERDLAKQEAADERYRAAVRARQNDEALAPIPCDVDA